LTDERNGFLYESAKDASLCFSFIDNEDRFIFVGVLMEIGRAICLDKETFNKIYTSTSQDNFLKSIQSLKVTPPKGDDEITTIKKKYNVI